MAAQTAMAMPPLDIPGTRLDLSSAGPVDSPATPSSQNALARFEFELGRGKEGTKILMVEWNPTGENVLTSTAGARTKPAPVAVPQKRSPDGWEVSWENKRVAFSVSEKEEDSGLWRTYFLLPTDATVPPMVTISHPATGRVLNTKCMPAIYAPSLGLDTSKEVGKRGVLHTKLAEKRLAQLDEEISREMQDNAEGVALEMVVQEREWLVEHFGLVGSPGAAAARPSPLRTLDLGGPDAPPTPQSPRSPIGGKLGEKLRGLKLATSPLELTQRNHKQHHPYSLTPAASGATATETYFQNSGTGGVGSLDAVMSGGAANANANGNQESNEDELFAMPLSPRSPEMTKSPFSALTGERAMGGKGSSLPPR